jgi:predicted unusual protein kinase regulating ubiquinone biosynthesis (AarF/ABC1/UbiB family)
MNDDSEKEAKAIPQTSLGRAARFLGTGVKLGGNYLSYLAKRPFSSEGGTEQLHEANAAAIYDSLSTLKGGALKVLQMLSLDTGLLPDAYADRFQLSQSCVPPLSFPLVLRVFQQTIGRSPSELFDSFSRTAVAAASMGQVHRATKEGKVFAVKIQYPGVAASIDADLAMVRPVASLLFQVRDSDVAFFLEEVSARLKEEVDYTLELARGIEISRAAAHLEGLLFPVYYPEYSGKRVLTMDWLDGMHLSEFIASSPSQEIRNLVGQRLWDFYTFQLHTLRKAHADPHPGNFLFLSDGSVSILDFGCVKEIPEQFYRSYFSLIRSDIRSNRTLLTELFESLSVIHPDDSPEERSFFAAITEELITLVARPFAQQHFDFSDPSYFAELTRRGEEISRMKEFRQSRSARGPRDALFLNRIFFGLYTMLHKIGASIETKRPDWLQEGAELMD